MNKNQILSEIDFSRLKRDYIKFPLKKRSNDQPFKEDLEYLYLEKNLTISELQEFFSWKTIRSFLIKFNIKKPLELELKSRSRRNFEKYGVSSPSKLDSVKQKSKKTCLDRYGVESTNNLDWKKDKCKQTVQERYGFDNVSKCKEIRDKISENTRKTRQEYGDEIWEKTKQTNLKRYGVEINSQMERWKNIWKNDDSRKRIMQKSFSTRKKNKTFVSSKPEQAIYKKILEKFPDCILHYREKRYPYNCDFYIPSKDLFIEYQGTWCHGDHPFDENNPEDLKIVEEWKRRSEELNFKGKKKNFYKMALYVWTTFDPLKRNLAIKNNLNWKEFFTIKHFDDWFKTL